MDFRGIKFYNWKQLQIFLFIEVCFQLYQIMSQFLYLSLCVSLWDHIIPHFSFYLFMCPIILSADKHHLL